MKSYRIRSRLDKSHHLLTFLSSFFLFSFLYWGANMCLVKALWLYQLIAFSFSFTNHHMHVRRAKRLTKTSIGLFMGKKATNSDKEDCLSKKIRIRKILVSPSLRIAFVIQSIFSMFSQLKFKKVICELNFLEIYTLSDL